jgi:histone H3/H4
VCALMVRRLCLMPMLHAKRLYQDIKDSKMHRSLNFSPSSPSYSYTQSPIFHLINTPLLPLPRQRLKHPRRQLISNQARENHQILRLLQQRIRNRPCLRIVKRAGEQVLAMMRAARNAPKQHVSNVARNLGRVLVEAVGRCADDAEVPVCGEGEDVGFLEALFDILALVRM